MLKKNPRTWATLVLQGKGLNPDQVSLQLGITADYTNDNKTINFENKPSIPRWQLNSKLSPDSLYADHLWDILKKIAPKRSVLKELCKEYEAVFYTSIEFADWEVDGISIEPRLLLLLGDLGISLEFLPWMEVS
ncbi:MAG: DUF4279 domain-containing protein [Leptospira sp.]|nr:DUF4279 domain-containing protein [Leptospira sp.]NCS95409.1 DUF4279 domain-containing protein [Leptospira sp.]